MHVRSQDAIKDMMIGLNGNEDLEIEFLN